MAAKIDKYRKKILAVLNSYPFMILICILIAMECGDLVSEVMVEHEITDKMVEDGKKIRSFITKLKQEDAPVKSTSTVTIDRVIITANNVLNVYETQKVRDLPSCRNFTTDDPTKHPTFSLQFESEGPGIFCGRQSDVGHFDLSDLSKRSDDTLQNIGLGLRIFGLVNITFMACEVLLRIACTGHVFFKRIAEVFDAFVVFTSLVLDYLFYNAEYESSSIIILLLLPWRIIRIVNSLILGINQKHRMQVKNLKQDKKKVEDKHTDASRDLQDYKENQERLVSLLRKKGATEHEIGHCIRQKRAQTTLAAVSTLASMMLMGSPVAKMMSDEDINYHRTQDGRKRQRLSTPNLMRKLSIPNTSTQYFVPLTGFMSPYFMMTPAPGTGMVFFPENFDMEAARNHLSTPAPPAHANRITNNLDVPEILVSDH